jgi:hypothetical protein
MDASRRKALIPPLIESLRTCCHSGRHSIPGAVTLEAITCALNERGVRPARWHVSSVANLLSRAQRIAQVRSGAIPGSPKATPPPHSPEG